MKARPTRVKMGALSGIEWGTLRVAIPGLARDGGRSAFRDRKGPQPGP
jgi:hypothetical protein